MKYYVCSPIGRTGSKRIVNGIWTELETNQKLYIPPMNDNHSSDSEHIKDFLDGFRIVTKVSKSIEKTEKIANSGVKELLDTWPSPIVCHSHNPYILPTDSKDWTFILSTRRDKIDIAFSIIMARETTSYDPSQPVDSNFKAFYADIEEAKTLVKYADILENVFIEKVKALTGKLPITIFVEDTWESLQQKIGIDLNHKEHDTATISTHRADEYIINYHEIIKSVK
jgi:hypothetical protein